jgi:hypothetical protein
MVAALTPEGISPLVEPGFRQRQRVTTAAAAIMLRHAKGFYLANAGQDTRAIHLPWPQEHSAHRALYRIGGRAIQGFLEGLTEVVLRGH